MNTNLKPAWRPHQGDIAKDWLAQLRGAIHQVPIKDIPEGIDPAEEVRIAQAALLIMEQVLTILRRREMEVLANWGDLSYASQSLLISGIANLIGLTRSHADQRAEK